MKKEEILIKDYTYNLPPERIAKFPLSQRDQSKLLVYQNGEPNDAFFYNLADYLPGGSMMVLNNTRVIEARILFQKHTGGVIEIFCLEPHHQTIEASLQQTAKARWECLIGGASKWKSGQVLEKKLQINNETVVLHASYIEKETDSFLIEFSWDRPVIFAEVIHAAGNMPLPPYIKREVTEEDRERYQTVFGKHEGSVAAPTASLHFTPRTFAQLKLKNIDVDFLTLHVGAGTFKPVKTETIGGHQMHREPFTVNKGLLEKMAASENIIVAGTTSLRTVESLHWIGVKLLNNLTLDDWSLNQWEIYDLQEKYEAIDYRKSLSALIKWMENNDKTELHCSTSIIIVPGYQFKIPKALITNFHQPQSTLLLLIAAFIGDDWKKLYQHALAHDYRFLSYGDSSLLWRKD